MCHRGRSPPATLCTPVSLVDIPYPGFSGVIPACAAGVVDTFGRTSRVARMKPVALALLVPLLANAQAFRCTVDGAVVYQQRPCAGGVALALPRAESASEWKVQVEAAIAVRDVMPGMTAAEVLRSWGKPTAINRTIVGERVSEQWVYRRGRPGAEQYLYLDDGVLRTVQSPA